MGCWNGTCGVSRLPIRVNEPIRLVILTGHLYRLADESLVRDPKTWQPDIKQLFIDEDGTKHESSGTDGKRKLDLESCNARRKNDGWRNGWYSGFSYPTDVFCPRSLPIKGQYNDYGSIYNLAPSLNQLAVVDQNQADLHEYPVGRFSIPGAITKDMPLISEHRDERGFLQAIERGGVTISGPSGRQPLAAWMVREDIYQAVLTSHLPGSFFHQPMEISSFYAAAEAYQTELIDQASKPPLEDLLSKSGMTSEERSEIFSLLRERRGSENPLVRLMQAPMWERGLNFYDRWMIDNIRSGRIDPKGDELLGLLREIAEFSFFSICVDRMRLGWLPQAGAGSQSDEVMVHAVVAAQMLKTIAEKFCDKDEEDEE